MFPCEPFQQTIKSYMNESKYIKSLMNMGNTCTHILFNIRKSTQQRNLFSAKYAEIFHTHQCVCVYVSVSESFCVWSLYLHVCVCAHTGQAHRGTDPLFLLWPGVQTQAAACGPAPCRVEPSPPASGPGFPSACTADIRTRWALAGPILCIPGAALASVCRVPIPSLM